MWIVKGSFVRAAFCRWCGIMKVDKSRLELIICVLGFRIERVIEEQNFSIGGQSREKYYHHPRIENVAA